MGRNTEYTRKSKIGKFYTCGGIVAVIVVLCVLSTLVFVFPSSKNGKKKHSGENADDYSPCPFIHKTTIDGSDRGASYYYGAAGTLIGRYSEPGEFLNDYDERGRPNPRHVSNKMCKQRPETKQHPRFRSMMWSFGQWVSHTISLSEGDPSRKINIDIRDDEHFSKLYNDDYMVVDTTPYVEYPTGYRQATSIITHFVDGNTIYGSDAQRGSFLRKFKDGLMQSQYLGDYGEFPPYNLYHVKNGGGDEKKNQFLVGDLRGNEQFPLMAQHVLFLREHNYQARRLKKENPDLDDECLFHSAKNIVIGVIQNIIFNEFIPALIGETLGEPCYNSSIDPRIYISFSSAAYRLHSLVNEHLPLHDPWTGKKIGKDITLRDAFFNPALIKQFGIAPLLLGLTQQHCESMDTQLVDSLRDFLFFKDGKPLDLCAINLARGRELGLPNYASMRTIMGMGDVYGWDDVTDDHETKENLKSAYGEEGYKNLDLFIGMHAEKKAYGETFGPLQKRIIKDQFKRLRDSDKYYFEFNKYLSKKDKEYILGRKYRDIILHNTEIKDDVLPYNVFLYEYDNDKHDSKHDDDDDDDEGGKHGKDGDKNKHVHFSKH